MTPYAIPFALSLSKGECAQHSAITPNWGYLRHRRNLAGIVEFVEGLTQRHPVLRISFGYHRFNRVGLDGNRAINFGDDRPVGGR
jgi:hypothetical protein